MRHTLSNGKTVNIPNKEIDNLMKSLDLTETEAVNLWLEDNDYQTNDEQNALDKKAKNARITRDVVQSAPAKRKPRTNHTSDEKKELFNTILSNLQNYTDNVEILKENKLIQVKIGEKIFKIDLIEQRPKK